jgi:hypothetical protein
VDGLFDASGTAQLPDKRIMIVQDTRSGAGRDPEWSGELDGSSPERAIQRESESDCGDLERARSRAMPSD